MSREVEVVIMNKEKIKSIFESKTFWANVLVFLIGIATLMQEQLLTGTALTSTAVINMILRTFTKNAVNWIGNNKTP